MGSRSASEGTFVLAVLRVEGFAVTLLAAGSTSTEFSRLTKGFLEVAFFTVVVAAGGVEVEGFEVLVVAVLALVVLIVFELAEVATFVRVDDLVAAGAVSDIVESVSG